MARRTVPTRMLGIGQAERDNEQWLYLPAFSRTRKIAQNTTSSAAAVDCLVAPARRMPPPDDLTERTIVFLDCGNIDRMPVDFLTRDGEKVLNVDHHHDNTRFGSINLVDRMQPSTDKSVACQLSGLWRP